MGAGLYSFHCIVYLGAEGGDWLYGISWMLIDFIATLISFGMYVCALFGMIYVFIITTFKLFVRKKLQFAFRASFWLFPIIEVLDYREFTVQTYVYRHCPFNSRCHQYLLVHTAIALALLCLVFPVLTHIKY